jgi:hypothetical protein
VEFHAKTQRKTQSRKEEFRFASSFAFATFFAALPLPCLSVFATLRLPFAALRETFAALRETSYVKFTTLPEIIS